jgi:hypothetical protein
MRIRPRSRALRAAKEIVLLPLGAVAGLHFAVRTWSSRHSLLPPRAPSLE